MSPAQTTQTSQSCPILPALKGSSLSCTSREKKFDTQVGLPCLVPHICRRATTTSSSNIGEYTEFLHPLKSYRSQ